MGVIVVSLRFGFKIVMLGSVEELGEWGGGSRR